MTALTDVWTMRSGPMLHSWTTGVDYEYTDNGDGTVTFGSNAGTQTVAKACLSAELFADVFGVEL